MAGEKLSWFFELMDRMSGPADKIAKSMGGLDHGLKAVSVRARDPVTGRFLKGQGVPGATSAFGGLSGALDKTAEGGSLLGKGAAMAATAVAGLAVATVAAGAAALAAGANFALHFLTFKEDAIAAFEAITGSKEAADSIFNKAVKFASVTPFKESEVVTMTQSLLARGFKENELDTLMKGVGDVGAILGTDKMGTVINALGRLRAEGKLTGREMQEFAAAGINSKLVFESLAKQYGKTEEEVKSMMSAGLIDDAHGIQAVMDGIAKGLSGGELGGGMKKASETVHGLMSTLEGRPEALLAHADFEPMMAPMKQFLKLLIDTLGPDTPLGHRITALFESIGKDVGEVFGILTDVDMTQVFDTVLAVLEPIVKLVTSFAKGGATYLVKMISLLGDKVSALTPDQLDKLARAAEVVGGIFVVTIGIIAGLVAAILAIPLAVMYAAVNVYDEFQGLWARLGDESQFEQLGIDLMLGLINGMLSMMSPTTDISGRIADAMADKFKSAFGFGPSPVVAPLGPEPQGAGGMSSPYGTSSVGSQPISSQPAPQVTVQMTGDVNVNAADVGDDPNAHGKAAASSFKASLASELAKLGLGSGGG